MKTASKNGERVMFSYFVYVHADVKTGLPACGSDGRLRGFVVARPDLPGVSSSPRKTFSATQGSLESAIKQVMMASGALEEEVCADRKARLRARRK